MAERTASDTHDPAVHFSACKQDDFQGKEQGPSEHYKAAQKILLQLHRYLAALVIVLLALHLIFPSALYYIFD